MVTPDPRRGDGPGDPDVTPGAPRPDNEDERPDSGTPQPQEQPR